MGNLGDRLGQGFAGTASYQNRLINGGWIVRYRTQELPSDMDFEVWHAAVQGPGGYFLVFLDDKLYGVGENGLINEYSPTIPMYVRKGQEISFHWSITTGSAPKAWIYLRTPEVGRI